MYQVKQKIRDHMDANMELLWCGRAARWFQVSPGNTFGRLFGAAGCAILTVAITWAQRGGSWSGAILFALFGGTWVYQAADNPLRRALRLRNEAYGIIDRRAINVSGYRTIQTLSIPLNRGTPVKLLRRRNGSGSVVFSTGVPFF
jgi:hypothetical protein